MIVDWFFTMNRPCPLYRGWSFPLQALLHAQLGIEAKGNLKHTFPSKETSRPDETESDLVLPVRPATHRRSDRPSTSGLTAQHTAVRPAHSEETQTLAIFPILSLGAKFGCKQYVLYEVLFSCVPTIGHTPHSVTTSCYVLKPFQQSKFIEFENRNSQDKCPTSYLTFKHVGFVLWQICSYSRSSMNPFFFK